MYTFAHVRSFEKGLLFRDGEFQRVLPAGKYRYVSPFARVRVDVVSMRQPWLVHPELDLIIASGQLGAEATVLDLTDTQRALVWMDGRFDRVLSAGRYVYWHGYRAMRVELVDARAMRFAHADLATIADTPTGAAALESVTVAEGYAGLQYLDGQYAATLPPGRYAFWRGVQALRVQQVDLREQVLDIGGQELMTADKVTLRLNMLVSYRIADPAKAVTLADDAKQALYREAQLALRAVVGTRELDALLAEKEQVARDLDARVRARAADYGLTVVTVGIRDIILPGEMRDLLNKVTEAKKAAEANLIARREETAAVRNQANTARLLEHNPTLMRLRELDVLEKIADKAQLQVILGDKGLADRVVHLL